MKLIKRDKCPITNEKNLILLHSFKNFPLFMGCVKSSKKKDVLIDMNWYIGRKHGVIQLNPLVPLKKLYAQSHGSGTVGKLWDKHHKSFAKFVSTFKLKKLIEIGAGHGQLIKNYFNYIPESEWIVVEPNPTIKKDSRIKIYKSLFDKKFKIPKEIDAIIHSHVIEHLYNPIELLKNINNKINDKSLHIFSVPNLKVMLEKKYTNALNFEHTLYLDEYIIDQLLKISGFKIIKKKYFMKDHSIFYATKKISFKKKIQLNKYSINKKLYMDYINFHLKLVNKFNKKISNTKSNIYLFGAHVFSQYLINFGLNTDKIMCILDNDKKKQNKRLYGTNLKVFSPKVLNKDKTGIVILRSGVYNNEIKKDILNNINKNIIFWE